MSRQIEQFEDPCEHKKCSGAYTFIRPDECSCHLMSPCNECIQAPVVCDTCDYIRGEISEQEWLRVTDMYWAAKLTGVM